MISAECSALLAASSDLHPLYGDRLSNHLPMALVALDRMGAGANQLERFTAHYSSRLKRRGASTAALDPLTVMGARGNFEGVRSYFAMRIAEVGADPVLRSWIPQLIPGMSASAFHALIRLAYGVDAGECSEIATGLAYWVTEYQPLGDLGARTDQTLHQIAHGISAAVNGHRFKPGIIIDRMVEICGHPAVQQARTQPHSIDYDEVSQFALEMYASREDFTMLHMVTACHAFAILFPYAGDATRATRYLWQATLIALLTTGHFEEPVQTPPHQPRCSWERCLQHASVSMDDHVIKLTYTAWRLFELTQDPLYLHVAWRKTFGAR